MGLLSIAISIGLAPTACASPDARRGAAAPSAAVRVKDCRNDQLLHLSSSAQALIGTYTDECQRRCGGR